MAAPKTPEELKLATVKRHKVEEERVRLQEELADELLKTRRQELKEAIADEKKEQQLLDEQERANWYNEQLDKARQEEEVKAAQTAGETAGETARDQNKEPQLKPIVDLDADDSVFRVRCKIPYKEPNDPDAMVKRLQGRLRNEAAGHDNTLKSSQTLKISKTVVSKEGTQIILADGSILNHKPSGPDGSEFDFKHSKGTSLQDKWTREGIFTAERLYIDNSQPRQKIDLEDHPFLDGTGMLQKGYAGPIHPNQYRLMEAGNYLQENGREVTINGVPLSEFRGNDLHGAPELNHEQQQEIRAEPSAPEEPLPVAEAVYDAQRLEPSAPEEPLPVAEAVYDAQRLEPSAPEELLPIAEAVQAETAVPLAEVVQVESQLQHDLSPKPTPSATNKADKQQEETYTEAPKPVNENGQSVASALPSSPAVAQSRERFGVDPTRRVQVQPDPSPANTASSPFAIPTLTPSGSNE